MTNSTAFLSGHSSEVDHHSMALGFAPSELFPGSLHVVDADWFEMTASTTASEFLHWQKLLMNQQTDLELMTGPSAQAVVVFLSGGGGHAVASADLIIDVGDAQPKTDTVYEDFISQLRKTGRPHLAEELIELINDMDEDPEEPSVKMYSLEALTRFLIRNAKFADPIVGPDPVGALLAEWHIDGDGLLVMAFLEGAQIHCVAQADATSHRNELNISVRLTEGQVVEEFGDLVPGR